MSCLSQAWFCGLNYVQSVHLSAETLAFESFRVAAFQSSPCTQTVRARWQYSSPCSATYAHCYTQPFHVLFLPGARSHCRKRHVPYNSCHLRRALAHPTRCKSALPSHGIRPQLTQASPLASAEILIPRRVSRAQHGTHPVLLCPTRWLCIPNSTGRYPTLARSVPQPPKSPPRPPEDQGRRWREYEHNLGEPEGPSATCWA